MLAASTDFHYTTCSSCQDGDSCNDDVDDDDQDENDDGDVHDDENDDGDADYIEIGRHQLQ